MTDHTDVSRLAGESTAVEDYWLITNLSRDKTYVVDNPEGGGEYLTVSPRRVAAPVPFEFARVSLPRRAAARRARRRCLPPRRDREVLPRPRRPVRAAAARQHVGRAADRGRD